MSFFLALRRKLGCWESICLTAILVSSMSPASRNPVPAVPHTTNASANGSAISVFPHPQTLVMGPRTPINPPMVGYHGQVVVTSDPESENNLIVCGARSNQKRGTAYEGFVYQSADNGKTWTEVFVDANSQWVSEESCTYGPEHQAYFVSGVSDTSHGLPHHEYGNLHLYRSPDGGRTWQIVLLNRFMDWTSMAADVTQGRGRNTLYIFANAWADGTGSLLIDKTPYLAVFRESPSLSFSVTSGNFNVGRERIEFPGTYPQGSEVLSDGTVLAIFSGGGEVAVDRSGRKTRIFSVEAGISKDAGTSLDRVIIYRGVDPPAVTGLAVNQTTDEIYVCWTVAGQHSTKTTLMLATSSDKGRSWSLTSVKMSPEEARNLRGGTVSLAANKDGVLGFMWYDHDGQRAYFGASFDRGSSIAQVVALSPAPAQDLVSNALAEERRLVVSPPNWDDALHGLAPLRILGFGPNQSGVPYGHALVADRRGAFHPVWNEVANGAADLWTRTITMQAPGRGMPLPNGLTDISAKIASHITNVRFDRLDNEVAFDLTVTNHSEATIHRPLFVVMPINGAPPEVSPDNADNEGPEGGAVWELNVPLAGLVGGHSAESRTMIFRVNAKIGGASPLYKPWDVPLKFYGKFP